MILVRAVSRANFIPVDRYRRPKKVSPPKKKKKKIKLLELNCLLKGILMKITTITTSTMTNEPTYEYFVPNMERRFSALNFLSTELRNTLVPNSLDKLM